MQKLENNFDAVKNSNGIGTQASETAKKEVITFDEGLQLTEILEMARQASGLWDREILDDMANAFTAFNAVRSMEMLNLVSHTLLIHSKVLSLADQGLLDRLNEWED